MKFSVCPSKVEHWGSPKENFSLVQKHSECAANNSREVLATTPTIHEGNQRIMVIMRERSETPARTPAGARQSRLLASGPAGYRGRAFVRHALG